MLSALVNLHQVPAHSAEIKPLRGQTRRPKTRDGRSYPHLPSGDERAIAAVQQQQQQWKHDAADQGYRRGGGGHFLGLFRSG